MEDDAYKILQARPARAAAADVERADGRDSRNRRAAPLRPAGADKRPRAGRQGGRRSEGRRPRQRRSPHSIGRISEISRKPEKKRRAARPGALLGRSRLGRRAVVEGALHTGGQEARQGERDEDVSLAAPLPGRGPRRVYSGVQQLGPPCVAVALRRALRAHRGEPIPAGASGLRRGQDNAAERVVDARRRNACKARRGPLRARYVLRARRQDGAARRHNARRAHRGVGRLGAEAQIRAV